MKKLIFSLMGLCVLASCQEEDNKLHGYVEGEYVYIAPTTAGILQNLLVERGQQVQEGEKLFALNDTELKANIATAESQILQAQAQFNNLLKGQRPEEIQVILKQKEQAKVNLENATKEYERSRVLLKTNAVSQSDYDKKEANYKSAKANLEQLVAQLKVATLGAREDEIEAAQANLEMSKQRLIQVKKQWNDAQPTAPTASYVQDTFYRKGEFIPAGKPVVSLLPPENLKIRFFVPEKTVPQMKQGTMITVTCDGCTDPIKAKVSYISSQSEYSPPVIYSTSSREKLVYMVEALPMKQSTQLKVGLPVDIDVKAGE